MSALPSVIRAAAPTEVVNRWRASLGATSASACGELKEIYRENWPTQGELIVTGACDFQCVHCIYPPEFARHNRGVSAEDWRAMLDALCEQLDMDTFVYGGRSLTTDGLRVVTDLRERRPAAQIGLIDNGISMLPRKQALVDAGVDWIDVSLDGLRPAHDLQRGRDGSFDAAVRGALWLKEHGAAQRINILTCLTELNIGSVCAMIREVNALGFKNFFITPVTVAESVRPAANLAPSEEQFAHFMRELTSTISELDDAWVEVLLFSPAYARYVADLLPEVWNSMESGRDSLVWSDKRPSSSTAFFVRYFPLSLTGIRELIVNVNGDVIVPKAMAYGLIRDEHKFGNLLRTEPKKLIRSVPDSTAFKFYMRELECEAHFLRSVM